MKSLFWTYFCTLCNFKILCFSICTFQCNGICCHRLIVCFIYQTYRLCFHLFITISQRRVATAKIEVFRIDIKYRIFQCQCRNFLITGLILCCNLIDNIIIRFRGSLNNKRYTSLCDIIFCFCENRIGTVFHSNL